MWGADWEIISIYQDVEKNCILIQNGPKTFATLEHLMGMHDIFDLFNGNYSGKIIVLSGLSLSQEEIRESNERSFYWGDIIPDKSVFHYKDGLFHREDGPAVEFPYPEAKKRFFLKGKEVSAKKIFEMLSDEEKEKMIWDMDSWI